MGARIISGYVYELVCPIKCAPVYVGSTRMPYSRFISHKYSIKSSDKEMYAYFRKFGVAPEFNIVDEIRMASWNTGKLKDAEYLWISYYVEMGYSLFNKNNNPFNNAT